MLCPFSFYDHRSTFRSSALDSRGTRRDAWVCAALCSPPHRAKEKPPGISPRWFLWYTASIIVYQKILMLNSGLRWTLLSSYFTPVFQQTFDSRNQAGNVFIDVVRRYPYHLPAVAQLVCYDVVARHSETPACLSVIMGPSIQAQSSTLEDESTVHQHAHLR